MAGLAVLPVALPEVNEAGWLVIVTVGCIGAAVALLALLSLDDLGVALWPLGFLLIVVQQEPAPFEFYFAATVLALLLRGQLMRAVPPVDFTVPVLLLLLTQVIGTIGTDDIGRAIAFGMTTAYMLLIAFVVYELCISSSQVARYSYLFAALLLAALALVSFGLGDSAQFLRADQFRFRGLFKDPNVTGPFVVPAAMLIISAAKRVSLATWTVLALMLLPVVLSQSRGALLALTVGLMVLAGFGLKRQYRALLLRTSGAGLVALVLIVVAALMPGPTAILVQRLGAQVYDVERFAGQAAGIDFITSNPLSFGIGPGNYEIRFGIAAHETYVRLATEATPLALAAFLALLIGALRRLRTARVDSIACGAAVIGFVAAGLFVDILHWRHFWYLIGVLYATKPGWPGASPVGGR